MSNRLGDQKRLHSSCVGGLPPGSRERDKRILLLWADDNPNDDLSDERREVLRDAFRILS